MAYGRYFKKKAKQATKAVGKRYGVSYGRKGVQMKKNSVAKIAKDLMWVKSRLNAEKKFIDNVLETEGAIGQVNGNGAGFRDLNVMPIINQGTGESNRVGNSIRATGMVIHCNFIKQQGAIGNRRIKVMLVKCKEKTNSVATDILDVNPLTGHVDYHSNLDYTELKDKTYQIIATKYVNLKSNGQLGQVSGDINEEKEANTATLKFAVKLNDVIRYEGDGDGDPANMRYRLVFVMDNGNAGIAGNTQNGVFIQTPLSGCLFQVHRRFWYVDN